MIRKIISLSPTSENSTLHISASDVNYSYGKKKVVILPLSFELSPGKKILISGPSGSGKTTLLKLVGGILRPTSGKIQVGELSNTQLQKERFYIFGYAFVDADFFESMHVRDNILIFPETLSLGIDMDWYGELLTYFEMKQYEYTPVGELSAGQRERINLIRAFIHKPNILLLDEPGSHLDTVLQKKLIDFITQYQEKNNATMIISSHGEFDPKFFDTFLDFHEDHHISLR